MKIEFIPSFHKSLKKINNRSLKRKITAVILEAEKASDISQIHNLKKLRGYTAHYRIRIGKYRIGVALEDDTLIFVTFADRKDIYKKFP